MLRLLNESHLLIDPLYGTLRRDPLARIPRRNMLREDEVFAAKLALAGPWGHVPEVLAHRNWKHDSLSAIARRLDVPPWRARCSTLLQCGELFRWLRGPVSPPTSTAAPARPCSACTRAASGSPRPAGAANSR